LGQLASQGREDVGCKVGEPVKILAQLQEFSIMTMIACCACAGIDVSAKTLDATVLPLNNAKPKRRRFANDANGHGQLIVWLATFGAVQVVCEATGVYHLDLAYALHTARIPLMVANPRQVKRFIEARACNVQTDTIDADELAQYALRMDFLPWKAPSASAFAIHKLGRAIGQMTKRHTALLNRLHAAQATTHMPSSIAKSLNRELRFIERERAKLTKEVNKLIAANVELAHKYQLLITIPGVAQTNGPAILAELIVLPPDLAAKAWVKYAGLDPASKTSGTSVQSKARIAKRGNARLRGSLYMAALTARRFDPHLRAFADRLIANHKTPLQAIVAIQRKLLHSIHAMFKNNAPWNNDRLATTQITLAV
jgi:transposase